MLSGCKGWRWITMGILAAAVLGVQPGWAQTEGEHKDIKVSPPTDKPPVGDKPAGDEGKKDDEKTDVAKPEKKDNPNDIQGGLGSNDQIRDKKEEKKAPEKALWEDLVNLPYLPADRRAQRLLFYGQYEKAEAAYVELLKTDGANQEYIENLCEAILREGHEADVKRFNDKVGELTEAQRSTAKMVRLRAEALLERGKDAEGRALLKAFVEAHPKLEPLDAEVLATYNAYGEALEEEAEYAGAISIYRKVADAQSGPLPDDSQTATELTFAVSHESFLEGNGRSKYPSVMSQLGVIEKNDATYWPERLLLAQVLLATHNQGDGGAALNEVLALNPNNLDALFLNVAHNIATFNFDGATTQLEAIKKRTDIALVDAYEGRMLLRQRLPEQAVVSLQAAVAKNPHLAEARGWLAAAYYMLNDEAKMNEQLSAIKAPTESGLHPVVLFQAAEVLRDTRQFAQAEKLYLEVDKMAKWWAEPADALAQLYLETGQEDKAHDEYEASFKIDPYDLHASNQLILLDQLKTFRTLESKDRLYPGSNLPAFIIRYDPQDDVLAHLAVEWLEKVRPELWSYFQIKELPAPTVVEFFPSHEQFGVRTTGLPWIGTVGASTGNVIALDVPRGGAKGLMGPFDWARVLRHEYTHTVTLAMTNNRIPHWLTEAAACVQEQAPRDWTSCQLLANNFRAGTLFKIVNLDWGFIKPKRPTDRQLAYQQSQWLYEYLVAAYGQPKMIDFLHAFHDGLTETQAWQKVYGKTMDDVDKDFHEWAEKQIASWGLPTDVLPKKEDMEAAVKKDPKDVAALIALGQVELMGGPRERKPAREHLERAVSFDPQNIKARELFGALLAQTRGPSQKADSDEGRQLLEGVVKDDPKRPLAVRCLGVLAMERGDYAEAEKWLKQLEVLCPLDTAGYSDLSGIYLVQKKYPEAIAQLLELEQHEQKDDRIPRRLAELYRQQGDLADAEKAAYRAIRINPYNAINHELLAQILVAEKETPRSIEYWADATELQPKVSEFWEGLADAKGDTGDVAGAAAAANKALEIQPNSPAKKWVKE